MAGETKEEILKSEKARSNRFAIGNPEVDLTAAVKLNKDPYLIPDGINTAGWSYFQRYLQKLYKDNPEKLQELNTNEGFLVSQQIINDFNQNYIINVGDSYDIWKVLQNGKIERVTINRPTVTSFRFLDKFPNGLIDIATVKAAQNYHLITSFSGVNRVLVDGWVGSQTSQLVYPGRYLTYLEYSEEEDINGKPLGILTKDGIVSSRPKYKSGLIPAIWGNRRFVVDARVVDQYINNVETGVIARPIPEKIGDSGTGVIPFEYFIPYEPSLHDATLQFKDQVKFPGAITPGSWDTIGQETIVYKDPTKINAFIKEQQLKDKKLRYVSDVKQTITSSKEDIAKQKALKKQAYQDSLTRSKELAKLYAK
jgi:hypothetical protein